MWKTEKLASVCAKEQKQEKCSHRMSIELNVLSEE